MDHFELEKKHVMKLVSQLIAKKKLKAKIDMGAGTIVFDQDKAAPEAIQSLGTLPSKERKEIEFLQGQYLSQINTLVEDKERNMDLLIN